MRVPTSEVRTAVPVCQISEDGPNEAAVILP